MTEAKNSNLAPPVVNLDINRAEGGYYEGFNLMVTIPAKVIVTLLIGWVILFPGFASEMLELANRTIIREFAGWYVYLVAFIMLVVFLLAVIPQSGKLRLGMPDEQPEFSRFSWFAMLFGAGIGIGMLTYSTGEPLAHFANNPDIIRGSVEAASAQAVGPAYMYTFMHWGFAAWASYALVGLGIGYVVYRRSLPLTIRSSLVPLFGKMLSGPTGHIVDAVAVVATILGVAVTMGLGVEQFIVGLHRLGAGEWLVESDGTSSTAAIIIALVLLVGASTWSALSGVGRGIKWLSNLNMGLSLLMLAVFLIFGSGLYAMTLLGQGLVDYIVNLPANSLTIFDENAGPMQAEMFQWQLDWSVFYWAWWIAFAPFVGMFIARVSRGRTIREYIIGVVLVPSLMCFLWMTIVGGTAIDLELSGAADGAILNAGLSDQLFATLDVMFSPVMTFLLSAVVVVLLMTYLITSTDSAILIVNTINGAGEDDTNRNRHIIFWGAALALVVGSMLILGGIDAIRITMIIGALPFSAVVILMALSIIKAVIYDIIRKRQGVQTHAQPAPAE